MPDLKNDQSSWEQQAKYVLNELERLRQEVKELEKFTNNMGNKLIAANVNAENFNEKMKEILHTMADLTQDFKTFTETISTMKVNIATKMAYGGLGGAIITGLVQIIEHLIKK